MPTSSDEVLFIAKILDTHIDGIVYGSRLCRDFDINYAKQLLVKELAEKVGFITDNYSVRKSLFDLCRHYTPYWKIPAEVIDTLIDKWHEQKSDIELYEFVGMSIEDWELFCRGEY